VRSEDVCETPNQGILVLIPPLERRDKLDVPLEDSTRQHHEHLLEILGQMHVLVLERRDA
jgi:hypothetical protein